MKFCANLSFMFLESLSMVGRYQLAKDAGFRFVESGFPFGHSLEETVSAKNASGIQQVLINLNTGDTSKGQLGATFDPEKVSEFRANLSTTISYAKALECSLVHVMAGVISEEPKDHHWETYESNLVYAAQELGKEGLIGVIEPINNHTVPKYFMNSFDRAVDIIKRINSPNMRLMMDIFHLQHIKGDLTNSIKKFLPYTGHVQIAQVPNRNEPNTPGEKDYRYILNLLEVEGYKGFVGLEYRPLNGTVQGLGWVREFGYEL